MNYSFNQLDFCNLNIYNLRLDSQLRRVLWFPLNPIHARWINVKLPVKVLRRGSHFVDHSDGLLNCWTNNY